FLPIAQKSRIGEQLGLTTDGNWRRFAVLTLHRPSNVDSMERLVALLEVISSIAAEGPVIFSVHPRTPQRGAQGGGTVHRPVHLVEPLGYLDFLCLMSKATLVLTDSGGIQEETTALGVPCLTLRENTERPVTITQGTNILVGTNPDKVQAAARTILAGNVKVGRIPPLWDGRAAERIVAVLLQSVSRHEVPVAATT